MNLNFNISGFSKIESIINDFMKYQIDWLTSHNDIALDNELEPLIIRFLKDTADVYIKENEVFFMEKKRFSEKSKEIIELTNGMSFYQWQRLKAVIDTIFDTLRENVEFETPDDIDIKMKQNFIS